MIRSAWVLVVLFLPAILNPYDAAAWGLLLFSYLMAISNKTIRNDGRVLCLVLFGLTLRHSLAIINSYFFTLIGSDKDASSFHLQALSQALLSQYSWHSTTSIYTSVLAFFYRLGSPSYFLGHEISIMTFPISVIYLIDILKILKIKRYAWISIGLFALVPSQIFFTSYTLREPFQLLFIIMSMRYGLDFLETNQKLGKKFFLMSLSMCAMGSLHNGLSALALIIWPLFVVAKISNNSFFKISKMILPASLLFMLFISAIYYDAFVYSPALKSLLSGNILHYVERYRYGVGIGRSHYSVYIDTSSPWSFLSSLMECMIYYLFYPFPWNVNSMKDIYACLEGLIRLFSIVLTFNSPVIKSRAGCIFFIIYLINTAMWSLGTTNFGTSLRHNIVHSWIIFTLAAPGYAQCIAYLKNIRYQKFLLIPSHKVNH